MDDELVIVLDGVKIFAHNFSPGGVGPSAEIVEISRSTLEQLAERAVTIQYRDVYGSQVEASAMWLIWIP